MMDSMQIKELAQRLNISPRAIRFYEEKGMIHPTKDPQNNYRLFVEKDVRRLQTIISLREVGMSIEEIKTVLKELDQGEQDEVLYALELQRSIMFSQWVELKRNIETSDQIIGHLKKNHDLVWEDIFELAKGMKGLRDIRLNWRDHWNFDQQASFHDELVLNNEQAFNKHPSYSQALKMVGEWVKPLQGEKGLDIGTGTGNLAAIFLEKGIEMSGIDQSKEMLKQCQRKFPNLETKLGNFLAIPYLDHSFEFVVTSYALHHLTDEQKRMALEEIHRVLKPHGRVCIVDLMFENQHQRNQYVGEKDYYADRSKLLDWFDQKGYITRAQQINDIVHIIYAVPIY
jgi:putative AdoMet-dependent methyltransferase